MGMTCRSCQRWRMNSPGSWLRRGLMQSNTLYTATMQVCMWRPRHSLKSWHATLHIPPKWRQSTQSRTTRRLWNYIMHLSLNKNKPCSHDWLSTKSAKLVSIVVTNHPVTQSTKTHGPPAWHQSEGRYSSLLKLRLLTLKRTLNNHL